MPERIRVIAAFMQFNSPTLEEAVFLLQEECIDEIFILPLFLLPGRHLRHDIPRMVKRIAGENPGVKMSLCGSLGETQGLCELIARWITLELPDSIYKREALDDLPKTGEEIMRESMRIVEVMLRSRSISEGDKGVIAPVVHATGDPTMVSGVSISHGAVERGVRALRQGRPVITDVRMVKAGLNHRLLEALRCPVFCAAEVSDAVPSDGTRVARGMHRLGKHMGGSLVVVGNAPTALMSVLSLMREGTAMPEMVIGTPVGMVMAMESKRALASLGIPHITVHGTRGGSAVAVAATNALIEMAARGKEPVAVFRRER